MKEIMSMLRNTRAFLIMLFPSIVKVWLLRLMGHTIGANTYIGFSFIDAESIHIGSNVFIGHLNVMRRLRNLGLQDGSRVSLGNWITGSGSGSILLGRNSSISTFHYFDASYDIEVGDNTIIAGRSSQFYTHGITSSNLNKRSRITIGKWCYIGSAVRFGPGAGIGHNCFVGMGAVVVKDHGNLRYALLVGVPAEKKESLPEDAAYFRRSFMPHRHHDDSYKG